MRLKQRHPGRVDSAAHEPAAWFMRVELRRYQPQTYARGEWRQLGKPLVLRRAAIQRAEAYQERMGGPVRVLDRRKSGPVPLPVRPKAS